MFSILAIIIGNICNENMNNVYTIIVIIKSSAYVISHSCFLFYRILFRGEVVNFLHVQPFNSSIYFTSTAFDSIFNRDIS
jgi:hypothetical protein